MVACAVFLVPVTSQSAAQATPDDFTPRPGPTFNSPVGDQQAKRAIFDRLIRSINSTPRSSAIKMFTWNFLTSEGADALLRAQRRGVSVQLLMDRGNNTNIENGPYRRLRRGLRTGNDARGASAEPSWARVCRSSCRGSTGSAHAKFFMFSRVGQMPRVVMQGSANFTVASANNQWNDIYTHVRNRGVWDYYSRVFEEAARDRKARRPFASAQFGSTRLMMFPLGSATDPVMQLLNQVRCRGAENTGTGRTRIRIAPDVVRHDRGMALARKVRALWEDGCDVRIGYTVMGVTIGRMLRAKGGRGPVPMEHLVRDYDGDGQFDLYFHLKSMSVVGNVGGDRSGYALLNGSANWSGLAAKSDENLGIYRSRRRTLQYQKHIDHWYGYFAGSSSPRTSSRMTAQQDSSDMLVFGTGSDAVYEDGTPYSTTGIDPFATMPRD